MGFPLLCIGAKHSRDGKPSTRAWLRSRVTKGAKHSREYMTCSTDNWTPKAVRNTQIEGAIEIE